MAISVYEQLNNMGINIDRTTLQQVSQNILKRAEQKNQQYQLANAQRYSEQHQNIGLDLYSGKIDTNLAKQISLNNSGLQISLGQETILQINYLNAIAAQNFVKGAEAKFSMAITDTDLDKQVEATYKTPQIVSTKTAKDKNGSNPFYNGELLMKNSKDGDEQVDEMKTITSSIFI